MQRLILGSLSVLLAFAVAAPTLASGKEIAVNTSACDSIPPASTTGGGSRERYQAIQLCNQEILLKQQQAMMSEMEAMMAQMKSMMAQMKAMDSSSQSGMSGTSKLNKQN